MRIKISDLVKVFVGTLILVILITQVGLANIINQITAVNPIFLLLAVITSFISLVIAAYNIRILLYPLNVKIQFPQLLKYTFAVLVVGVFVPGRFGELSLIYFLRKGGATGMQATEIVAIQKGIIFLSTTFFATFGLYIFLQPSQAVIISSFFLALVTVSLIVFFYTGKQMAQKYFPEKYTHKIILFLDLIAVYIQIQKKTLVINLGISLLNGILFGLTLFILFLGYGVQISIFHAVVIRALLGIASTIPLTFGGIGIRESLGVLIFAQLGVNISIATSVFLLLLIIRFIFAGAASLFILDKTILSSRKNTPPTNF